MQKGFTIRKFNQSDLQSVMNLNQVCLPENYIDSFFIDLYRRYPDTFIVAEENGDVVGYIMCRIEVGLSNYGLGGVVRNGHVVSIAVKPENRKKGIGKTLMEKAMEAMRTYKAKQCFLEVRVTNDSAVGLYKKLGFDATKTVHGYYADGEDAYMMTKKLQ